MRILQGPERTRYCWSVTPDEEQTILAALPPLARSGRFDGTVAGVLVEHRGRMLDGGVVLGHPHEVFLRPLPPLDRAGLETWAAVLERRRSQLAHDLSGPAMGVLAALETVLEYEPVAESTRSLLEDARHGILHLTERLADRSALLGGPANALAGPLRGLLTRLVEPIARSLDPQGHRLNVRVRAADELVRVDAALLQGALGVLLGNAWRHRHGQSVRVRIGASVEDDHLALDVSDDGRGMDEATLRRAGELGFSTRPNGVGAGLFLLKQALSARGGAVLLESYGRGARATVLLPLNSAVAE